MNGQLLGSGGQRLRSPSHDAIVRSGTLAEASLSTHSVELFSSFANADQSETSRNDLLLLLLV